YTTSSDEIPLSKKQRHALQTIILNDESYYFDITKLAVFLPEIGFKFKQKGGKEVVILVNLSGKQLKFVKNKQSSVILDYDPGEVVLSSLFQDLIKVFGNSNNATKL